MSLMGWTTVTGDPDYGLFPVYHSDNWGEAGNRNFYGNPRVDELLDLGRTTTDDALRMQNYREAQELIMADLPLIPLWESVELHATRDNIGGFRVSPTGILSLWSVYFE
jgi:peptide/nickel transport system substrate-binding protein